MIWQLSDARRLDLSERTHVMGILNVTPDSFYDGGHYQHTDQAIERALAMVAEGADILGTWDNVTFTVEANPLGLPCTVTWLKSVSLRNVPVSCQ